MNQNIEKFIYRAGGFVKRNSSTILTCIGAAGVIATAVTAGFGAIKASKLLDEAREEKDEELTALETVCAVAPAYIPPVVIGVSTIVCIFGANALNKRQQASLISAYALLKESYSEYRNTVTDIYGADADEKVKSVIYEKKYESSDFKPTDKNKLVFYEEYYGDFFEASESDIYYALYHFNRNFQLRGYATVAEFHEFLNLPVKEADKALGWSDGDFYESGLVPWIDFYFIEKTLDDGMSYMIICPQFEPSTEFMADYI